MMLFALVACGGGGGTAESTAPTQSTAPTPAESTPPAPTGETVTLKVWASQEEQELLAAMIEEFKAANPENTYEITQGVVAEPDAYAKYSEDPAAAADVFFYANDQLRSFVKAGGLYEVTRNKDDIVARNMAGAIDSATLDGKLYGYPATADNGYFLYYDKSVFTEEDVKSLDKMMEVADAAGKKIFMDISNGWYIASFFLGAGGKLGVEVQDDGKMLQTCDFNNAAGLAAAEAIKAFTADASFQTGDDAVLTGGMGDMIAAGVSGTWNATAIQEKLGDNYAAAKLPTFTLGGEQVQMASFGGYKLVGVNSTTANPVAACDLADFLTNEANQVKRFEARELGPSNIAAASSDAVKANIALAALAAQSEFAQPQKDVLGSVWTPMEAFGNSMETKDYSIEMQALLDSTVEQIQIVN
jgi:arabinogalactan oligomer/maltooligosaccharide transport system substrate-binding protein